MPEQTTARTITDMISDALARYGVRTAIRHPNEISTPDYHVIVVRMPDGTTAEIAVQIL